MGLYFPTFEEMFIEDDALTVNTDSIIKNQVNIDSLFSLDDTTQKIDLEAIKKACNSF